MIFTTLLSWLGNLLGGPFARAAVDAYSKKLDATNSSERIAAELATRELTVQQRELELQMDLRKAQIGVWYEPEKIMGYCVAIYLGKLLVWDKVFALGSTDPLAGWVEVTANLIIASYFAKRTFENVASILKRR